MFAHLYLSLTVANGKEFLTTTASTFVVLKAIDTKEAVVNIFFIIEDLVIICLLF